MKIAFLGKGGSGKSTMATAFVNKLNMRGFRVLAIDADHNMDLSYNLGSSPTLFLGNDPEYIKEYLGYDRSVSYKNIFDKIEKNKYKFYISPTDEYTNKISIKIKDDLRLITAGPHTERVRSQEYCSHSLAAPLKIYLPLLKLNKNEIVIIDERAGTDPVATGILNGVDLAIIVREQTVNSIRVADQIKNELDIANIQYLIVDNKKSGIEIDTDNAIERVFSLFPLDAVSV